MKGEFEHQRRRLPPRGEPSCDAGAERFADDHDAGGRIGFAGGVIGRLGVAHEFVLRRRSAGAGIAAIGDGEEAIALADKIAEARDAVDEPAGVAVKIEKHRPPLARRRAPSDDRLAVCRREGQLLDAVQARLMRRDVARIRQI